MAVDPPLSPPIRQYPPDRLVNRTARVGTEVTNTIRVPHDRFHDRKGEWYSNGIGMPSVVEGNQVKYLIDGKEAFGEMVAAMRTASAPGDFIYMVNWCCDVDFPLLQSDEPGIPEAQTNLRQVLTQASEAKVMIRAMFWKEPASNQNLPAVNFLRGIAQDLTKGAKKPSLFNAAAIHDDRGDKPISLAGIRILGSVPRALGSQHQKVLCVFGGQRLICFCGGIDFKSDRIPASHHISDSDHRENNEGAPLHDVHCRITGPAAWELVRLFAEKWNDHPLGKEFNDKKGPLIIPPVPDSEGNHSVQITRTFKAGIYEFRRGGEQTAAAMIGQAIRNAKRFIYTECQYFTGAPALEAALLAALPKIEHLTVVLTHWEINDLPFVNFRRRQFIEKLTKNSEHAHKVRIFTLQPNGNTREFQDGRQDHTYVHSKIWIVDDEFAVIGSVNSNKRSWMHDSEVAAGIYETSTDSVLRYRLAHWLRIEIWKEHLNMRTVAGSAELADGVASAVHWLQLPEGARVRRYNLDERNYRGQNDRGVPFPIPHFVANSDLIWNNIFDPC